MVPDLNPSVLITMEHENLWQHLRPQWVYVCEFSGEKNSFMTETTFTDIASFSACVIPTKTHLLLWPVLVLYELWLKEGGVEAGID